MNAAPDTSLRLRITLGLLVVTLAVGWLTLRAAPRLDDGASELTHVQLVMSDEHLIQTRVLNMLAKGNIDHGVRVYPGLYPYKVALTLALLGADATTHEQVIAVRAVSLLTTVVALLLMFFLLWRLTREPWVSALATALVALHPETVLWASRIHPDADLLLFQTGALLALTFYLRDGSPRALWWGTALAALSAGTKLVGAFIIPVIVTAVLLQEPGHWRERTYWRSVAIRLAQAGGIFLLVFLCTTPQLVTHTSRTVTGLLQQHKAFRNQTSLLEWVPVLATPRGLGMTHGVVLLGALGLAVWQRSRLFLATLGFAAVFTLYVGTQVHIIEARYVMPVLWATGLAFALGLAKLAWKPRVALMTLVLGAVVFDSRGLAQAYAHDDAKVEHVLTPDRLALHAFLSALLHVTPYKLAAETSCYPPDDVYWATVWDFGTYDVRDDFEVAVVGPRHAEQREAIRTRLREREGFAEPLSFGVYDVFLRGRVRQAVQHGLVKLSPHPIQATSRPDERSEPGGE